MDARNKSGHDDMGDAHGGGRGLGRADSEQRRFRGRLKKPH